MIGKISILCCLVFVTVVAEEECIKGPSTWYRGTRNVTANGIPCQRWDVTVPHKPNHIPEDGGKHNYCRNPDGDLKGTWCYTTRNDTRWAYCNITKCEDKSLVIWTNYDASTESTHLLSVQADPEIVKNETDHSGTFNVTVVTGTNKTMSEFWALAASYGEKTLYFTDYRSEYVGIRRMQTNMTLRFFEGMAHGIESMAYDWKTKNLYWSDSEFKWIMAAEKNFDSYVPVYRTDPDPPYGLAIHSVKRQLIFSTYKALGSKIITTDLAGKNATTLFKFPEVFDVTGITVDYTDDRIYWTDFTGYGGMVMSSKLDGSNKTQHHYRGGSIFWGVAAYLDYLYVTDVHARYSMAAEKFYSVWIINKQTKQTFRYTLNGKPRGISVYSENEEYSIDESRLLGECDVDSPCDHICLPRINAKAECACSLGYHLGPDGKKCISKLVDDEYLLLADAGQGKIFQIPIDSAVDSSGLKNYSVVPIKQHWKTVAIAVDQKTKFLYWSDKKNPTVNKGVLDGSRSSTIVNKHANSIAVDPHTGNVFWSDNENDNIYISNEDGDSIKSIVQPEPGSENSTSIRMIVQDLKNRYLYWTDTNSAEGKGQVWRCRFDGSEKKIILNNLNWPHAITVDYRLNSLFVGEAKLALIYELNLDTLTKTTVNISHPSSKQHDVSPYISRINPYIIDIKVHKDLVYVVDGKSSRLERFNLTQGPSSMKPYGPAEFFRVTTVSVFSESTYNDYIKPIKNPCNVAFCRQICVAKSDDSSVCICPDGQKLIGSICVKDGTYVADDAPTTDNCPEDIIVTTPSCQGDVVVDWTVPVWKDDKTPTNLLRILKPTYSPPYRFSAGDYKLLYTATDSKSNVGHCSFSIRVTTPSCSASPPASPGMKKSALTCGLYIGSEFTVSCIQPNYQILSQGKYYANYTVACVEGQYWASVMDSDRKCVSTATTPPTPSITTKISTTPSTKSTTQSMSQPNTTPATPKQTSKPTTTPPTKITQPTSTTTSSSKTPSVTPKVTTTKTESTTKNGTGNAAGVSAESSAGSALSGGAIAGICILVIALLVIVVIIVFVTIRNRPIWEVSKFSFPVFWKSKSDGTVNMGASSNTNYEIMT